MHPESSDHTQGVETAIFQGGGGRDRDKSKAFRVKYSLCSYCYPFYMLKCAYWNTLNLLTQKPYANKGYKWKKLSSRGRGAAPTTPPPRLNPPLYNSLIRKIFNWTFEEVKSTGFWQSRKNAKKIVSWWGGGNADGKVITDMSSWTALTWNTGMKTLF